MELLSFASSGMEISGSGALVISCSCSFSLSNVSLSLSSMFVSGVDGSLSLSVSVCGNIIRGVSTAWTFSKGNVVPKFDRNFFVVCNVCGILIHLSFALVTVASNVSFFVTV